MTPPGSRLLALASRWCSAATLTRVVEPLVADMQAEHHEALAQGRTWRAGWIRVASVVALVKVLALSAGADLRARAGEWSEDDANDLTRMLGIGVVASGLFLAMGMVSPLKSHFYGRHPSRLYILAMLTPQALPLAVPVGVTCGIFVALAGRAISRRLIGATLGLAFVASLTSFVTIGWVVPEANHSVRVAVSGLPHLFRGPGEMTITELRRRMADAPFPREARAAAVVYHQRVALAWAPLSLALLTLAVLPTGRPRPWIRGLTALVICGAYAALVSTSQAQLREATAIGAAWLANVMFVMAAAIAWLVTRRRGTSVPFSPRTGSAP